MEKIYLVLVNCDEEYEHPDWGWHGMVHELSLAGVYTKEHDAKNKKEKMIKEGVWYGDIHIQCVDVNKDLDKDNYICLYETVEYE